MRKLLTIWIVLAAIVGASVPASTAFGLFQGGMFSGGCGGASCAGTPSTTTWNPSDKSANLSLSGGNLVVTNTGSTADSAIRSVVSYSSGKKYYETTASGAGVTSFGIANASAPLSSFLGSDNNGVGSLNNGNTLLNFGNIGTAFGWNTGDVLGIAVDLTAKLFWIKNITAGQPWNNNGSADPATGVGGFSFSTIAAGPYFAAACVPTNGESTTTNFGATAYTGTAPSGFSNW
jgi:hypothetical protein